MNKHLLIQAAVTLGLMAPLGVSAQVVFSDNFNNVGGTTSDLNEDLAIRQSGSYVTDNGTVNWAQSSAGPLATKEFQNRLDQLQTNLGGTVTDAGRAVAYTTANFGASLSGLVWTASFDMSLEVFSVSGSPSAPLSATDYRFIIDTTTADITGSTTANWDIAVRFLPFESTGNFFIRPTVTIGGSSVSGLSDIAYTPTGSGEFYSPLTQVTLTIDEANNTLALDYGATNILSGESIAGAFNTGTAGTATDRYTGFSAFKGDNAPSTSTMQHIADDYALTVIPEPSTVALLMGGLSALMMMRRRRAA